MNQGRTVKGVPIFVVQCIESAQQEFLPTKLIQQWQRQIL